MSELPKPSTAELAHCADSELFKVIALVKACGLSLCGFTQLDKREESLWHD